MKPHQNDIVALTQFARNDGVRALSMRDAQALPFNILTLTNSAYRETLHSDILAFLLDANAGHGLSNRVSTALLSVALPGVDWAVYTFETLREHRRIDVLLRDPHNQQLVIIENKIQAPEHGDQLRNYWRVMHEQHPHWHIAGVLLTPKGSRPSDTRYYSLNYLTVCKVLEHIVSIYELLLFETKMLLQHYTDILRGHIMEQDPEVSTAVSGAMPVSTGALSLGGNAVWPEYFAGRLDDVRIYNRALSQSEIQASSGVPVTGSATPAFSPGMANGAAVR